MSSKPRSLADANVSWCPFFRRSSGAAPNDPDAYATNRRHDMRDDYCIGPECMAWRNVKPPQDRPENEIWGVCDMMPGRGTAVATDGELPF